MQNSIFGDVPRGSIGGNAALEKKMQVKVCVNDDEKTSEFLKHEIGKGDLAMEVSTFTEYQKKALSDVCRLIFKQFPNTVGIAFLHLDCDCIKLVGVSLKGEQTSPMMRVPGNAPAVDEKAGEETIPECVKCSHDTLGIFREKFHGMVWNEEKVRLSPHAKKKIRSKVFHPDLKKIQLTP